MPRLVFTAGEVLQAATMNDLSDQSVMVFAGTAARGSAIPSPSEGMVTYRSDDDVVEVFDGSVFKAVGPGQILQVVSVRNTTQTLTTSGTFVNTSTTATITPSSTSSKILVLVSSTVIANGGFCEAFIALFRGDVTGSNQYNTRIYSSGGPSSIGHMVSIVHLDSPSTTSPQQYMLGIAKQVTSTNVIEAEGGRPSSITLMEVAG